MSWATFWANFFTDTSGRPVGVDQTSNGQALGSTTTPFTHSSVAVRIANPGPPSTSVKVYFGAVNRVQVNKSVPKKRNENCKSNQQLAIAKTRHAFIKQQLPLHVDVVRHVKTQLQKNTF
jgi:hypothetical protein